MRHLVFQIKWATFFGSVAIFVLQSTPHKKTTRRDWCVFQRHRQRALCRRKRHRRLMLQTSTLLSPHATQTSVREAQELMANGLRHSGHCFECCIQSRMLCLKEDHQTVLQACTRSITTTCRRVFDDRTRYTLTSQKCGRSW
jgi:hypothetical protein